MADQHSMYTGRPIINTPSPPTKTLNRLRVSKRALVHDVEDFLT